MKEQIHTQQNLLATEENEDEPPQRNHSKVDSIKASKVESISKVSSHLHEDDIEFKTANKP